MFKLVLEKAEEPEIKSIHWIIKKAREFQKNIYFCFSDYAIAFDCVDHNKLWKILKEMEYQSTWPVSWETYMQVRKQQLEQLELVCCSMLQFQRFSPRSEWSEAHIRIRRIRFLFCEGEMSFEKV